MNNMPRPRMSKKATQDQTLTQLPLKTGHTGAPPLMTKTHYSFAESLRFIRSKFPEFTRENLLNHGFQGDVSFVVRVPPGVSVHSLHHSTQQNLQERRPHLLSLHPFTCEFIERSGVVHSHLFPNGYWTSPIGQQIQVMPNYQVKNGMDLGWQTLKDGSVVNIPITTADLLVTHIELLLLAERIRLRVEDKTSRSQQQVIVQSTAAQLITKHFQSLKTISSNIPDSRPEDLLRHAIQRNLPLFGFIPSGKIIRSSSVQDFYSGVEYFLRPQFLELTTADCLTIYKEDSVAIAEFSAGNITDLYGENKRISPHDERGGLPADTAWKIYDGLHPSNLTVNCHDLYALVANIPELIATQAEHDLKIPQGAITQLQNDGYIRIDRAVELLKLNHPACTVNHLLQLKQLEQLDFVTLAPSGIEIRKSGQYAENDQLKTDQPLLTLDKDACQTIQRSGEAYIDSFSKTSFPLYSPYDAGGEFTGITSYLSTYYQGKPHPIKLSADCLFTQRAQVLKLLERSIDFWDQVTSAISEKPTGNAGDLKQQKDNGPSPPKSQPGEPLLGSKAVMKRLGISKGKLDYLIKDGHPNYDETFPKPVEQGGKHRKWKESDIDAISARLAASDQSN